MLTCVGPLVITGNQDDVIYHDTLLPKDEVANLHTSAKI